MIAAGVDVGLQTVKVIILNNQKILSHVVLAEGRESAAAVAEVAFTQALAQAKVSRNELRRVIASGVGRKYVAFADEQLAEFICLARGIHRVLPSVSTVLDMGAGKSLAVSCRQGIPSNVFTGDRCAAGAGVLLELVASVLGISVEDIGKLSLLSREPVDVESICAVFMETEIISQIYMKKKPSDILKGVCQGLASRAYALLLSVGLAKDVAFVGGVARNIGVVKELEALVGSEIKVPENPQIIVALGAAILAAERGGS
ncbi:acyl-CoA dehydratase activase [Chloroflexota bacterium]